MYLIVFCEDLLGCAAVSRICIDLQIHPDRYATKPVGGKSKIDLKVASYNAGASRFTWLGLLRDLDHDADSAQSFVTQNYPPKSEFAIYGIAVREVEAWLLASRPELAELLGCGHNQIPADAEGVADPKLAILSLCRLHSPLMLRKQLLPVGSEKIGPEYNSVLEEFISNSWNLQDATERCPSLANLLGELERFRDYS